MTKLVPRCRFGYDSPIVTRRPASIVALALAIAVSGAVFAGAAPVAAAGSTTTTTTTTPPPANPNDPGAAKGLAAVAAARTVLGQPYRSGGESVAEGGFDCSGLTYFAWNKAGVVLPRSSTGQYAGTTRITKAALRPGDLVFYSASGPRGRVSHVALYAGNGKLIQARRPGVNLRQDDLATYWKGHLVGYGRVKVPAANPAAAARR